DAYGAVSGARDGEVLQFGAQSVELGAIGLEPPTGHHADAVDGTEDDGPRSQGEPVPGHLVLPAGPVLGDDLGDSGGDGEGGQQEQPFADGVDPVVLQ